MGMCPNGSAGKESTCNAGDTGRVCLFPKLRRSFEGGNGNPHQYSCLKNPIDRGARKATVQTVTKSWTKDTCMCLTNHFPMSRI